MSYFDLTFYVFAIGAVVSAGMMVFSRNLIYCAVGLLFSLASVAGIYVLLGADFLAATQLMVYVGGILALLLFGIMLSVKFTGVELRTGTLQMLPGLIIVAGLFLLLVRMIYRAEWAMQSPGDMLPTTATIGKRIMTDLLIPFEIASILLLIALIGAAYMARRERS